MCCAAALLLLPACWQLVLWTHSRFAWEAPNFQGRRIPRSAGLVVVLWSLAAAALLGVALPEIRSRLTVWVATVLSFGLLGLGDDVWGDSGAKGLRGHVVVSMRRRRPTSGLVKAVGGGLVSLAAGVALWPRSPLHAVVSALATALAANAVNLLDLRPGRAAAACGLTAMAVSLFAAASGRWPAAAPAAILFVAAAATWPADSRAEVMMGDAGSNPLGAGLGLAASMALPLWAAAVLVGMLVGLHALAERASLSAVIEGNRALLWLDTRTGVRSSAPRLVAAGKDKNGAG